MTGCSSPPRAGSPSSPSAWSATSSWGACGATRSVSRSSRIPPTSARLLLTQQFPRLVDPGPVLERFLERFFPSLLVPTQPLNQVNYTWSVYYNFDQYLWSPEGAPDRGIGVFFRFGASDGVANPIKYAYNVGIGAKGLCALAAVRQLRDRLGAHGAQ